MPDIRAVAVTQEQIVDAGQEARRGQVIRSGSGAGSGRIDAAFYAHQSSFLANSRP